MLTEILPVQVFAYFLVFLRLGAALMLIPGIGEPYVSSRIRLALAAVLTIAVAPFVSSAFPVVPDAPIEMFFIMGGEIIVGLLIGAAARFTMMGLHVAGTLIAFQTSLGFALCVDPTQGTQGALVATFLTLLGLVLIFATNLHHLMLRALFDSYVLFVPGTLPPVADFADLAVRYVSSAFRIGVQIAAPFIVYGLVFYISLGLLARLMPQLQVFFIAIPLQIIFGLILLAIVLPPGVLWFLDYFEGTLIELVGAHRWRPTTKTNHKKQRNPLRKNSRSRRRRARSPNLRRSTICS